MPTRGSRRNASTMSCLLRQDDRSVEPAESFGNSFSVVAKFVTAGTIGRFGWGVADQLLSSATNFLLGVLVARTVSARDLGAFSVAYATFTFSLGAVRAIAAELLAVRHSALGAGGWHEGVRGSTGTALMVGILVGLGCLIAGPNIGGRFGSVFTIVGVSLPFLLVQDVSRFALVGRGRGGAAFLNDA